MANTTMFSERYFQGYLSQLTPFVEKVGLTVEQLACASAEIPVEKYAALLDEASRKIDPLFAFEMGQHLELHQLGVIGHAAAACETVADALGLLSKYIYAFSHMSNVRLDIGASISMSCYQFPIGEISHRRHDVELVAAATVGFIRRHAEAQFRPEFVEFEHPLPVSTGRYHSFFGCESLFGRSDNRIGIPNEVLSLPLNSADARLLEALTSYLDQHMNMRNTQENLLFRIRHLVSASLGRTEIDLRSIAQQVGMSERTVQRRLRSSNMVFGELVDHCRQARATAYVRSTDYPLTEVAQIVGYGELSSFVRRQGFWNRWLSGLAERLAHLLVDIRRLDCGTANAVV